MPRAGNAGTYTLRDIHALEKVGVAVEPYDGRNDVFSVDYDQHGLMPVFFVVSNDGDQPVRLSDMSVRLVTPDHTKIEPSNDDDIFRRLSRTEHRGDESSRTKSPLPLPGGKPKVGVKQQTRDEVTSAQFKATAVEPHSTRAGFFFFDISGLDHPRRGSRIYVTGVRTSDGQELMYFETPLETSQP